MKSVFFVHCEKDYYKNNVIHAYLGDKDKILSYVKTQICVNIYIETYFKNIAIYIYNE